MRRDRSTTRRAAARHRVRIGVVAATAIAVASVAFATGRAEAQQQPYREPVDAVVVDGYRPPAHVGAPGNRGWEYDTTPGLQVMAAGSGVVSFVGMIAGVTSVSVLHPDGFRTTYTGVRETMVVAGQVVAAGEVIGAAGDRLHFGVRGEVGYVDPAALFAGGTAADHAAFGLRLVPFPSRGSGRLAPAVAAGGRAVPDAARSGVSVRRAVVPAFGWWRVAELHRPLH